LSLKKLVSVCRKAYKWMILSLRTLIFYPQSSFQKTYITEISHSGTLVHSIKFSKLFVFRCPKLELGFPL
jgi:hypothetical protein